MSLFCRAKPAKQDHSCCRADATRCSGYGTSVPDCVYLFWWVQLNLITLFFIGFSFRNWNIVSTVFHDRMATIIGCAVSSFTRTASTSSVRPTTRPSACGTSKTSAAIKPSKLMIIFARLLVSVASILLNNFNDRFPWNNDRFKRISGSRAFPRCYMIGSLDWLFDWLRWIQISSVFLYRLPFLLRITIRSSMRSVFALCV